MSVNPPRQILVLAFLVVALIFVGVALLLVHDSTEAAQMEAYRRGWLVIGLALVIGCATVWQEYRRVPEQFLSKRAALFAPLSRLPLPPGGRVLLDLDSAYLKQLRQAQWYIVGAPLLMLAVLVWMNLQTGGMRRVQMLYNVALGVPMLVWLVSAPWMLKSNKRAMRRRIGADSENLLYDPGDGVVQRHAWPTVMCDGRSALLFGKQVMQLSGRRLAPFPVEPFKGYVLARVPEANRISVIRLFWLSICRGNRSNQLLLTGLVVIALIQLAGALDLPFMNAIRTFVRQ